MILAEIMDKTIRRDGRPASVVNLVHGFGESAGKALTKHPAIKAVAFVGETTTGSPIMRHLQTPFGGAKMSGIGRDGGDYSFDFYMETKNVAIAYDTHHIPA